MRSYLRGKGWTARNPDAHVGTLKFARGDRFFYINTHAGRYQATVGTIFSIQSATLVDSQYAQIFAD
ncbi:MAG: hypothetical protein IPM02_23220, partial [Betaproteobacteria bacterium]|nr:hypothetical protein [Betaproteobacteria bacterium]